MSLAHDPTLRGLDDCGCCEGLGMEAPEVIENRPGVSAVAYRVGTHSRFKNTMLARLSSGDLRALNRLTTRSDSDFTIALLDASAAVADVLSFYQERLANESWLRTATERRSIVELANLIGYVPRPGVAASTYLAFKVDDTGLPGDVPIPVGTRVQSIPGPGERPQVFETVEAIAGRAEWNAMKPLQVRKHPTLTTDTKRVTVRGTATNLQPGDSVLLVCGASASDRVVKRVLAAVTDPAAQTTRVDLDEDPPAPPPFVFTLLPFAPWNPAPVKLTKTAVATKVLAGAWKQADLKAYAAVQKWSLPKLNAHLVAHTLALLTLAPQDKGVFAFRQRAAIFGHNAPKYSTLPATQRMTDYVTGANGQLTPVTPPYPNSWENRKLSHEPGGQQRQVDLDTTYPGIVRGSWLVLEDEYRRNVYKVQDNTPMSRADYTLSAKVSRIKLSSSTDFSNYGLRTTAVLAQSEKLELAELPIADVVKDNRIVLDRTYLGLTEGRPVVVTGKRTDLEGVTDSEVVMLTEVLFSEGHTELVFRTKLAHDYERASVTVNANVALATHGETKEQALGSGDSNHAFQRFPLPEAPLTYVPATNVKGAASTLSVRIDELLWHEVDFLYGHGPDEHVFITRTDDEGRTWVQFGDGRQGARVPSGQENVRATYRLGMGTEGLVVEGQLSLLLSKPLGIGGVINPLAAGDAASAESGDDVRRNAALPIRTLDRIVSLRDYEDFSRAFTGIAKALATWTWDGYHRGVFVTVAGPGGAMVTPTSLTYRNLVTALRNAGDPTVPVRVESYLPAFFLLSARVGVDPAYQAEHVLQAAEAALRTRFSFEDGEFGAPVTKSQVIATVQSVPGVVAVDLDGLQRVDALVGQATAGTLADRLTAHVPRAGTNVSVAAELLLLDPRRVALGVMTP